jgi:hypothetical protein
MIYNGTCVLAHSSVLCSVSKPCCTYLGSSRPGIASLEADPSIDVWNGQELGNLAVCDNFMLYFFEDAQGHGVPDQTSHSIFGKTCRLADLVKGNTASSWDHVLNFVAAYSVDSD